MKPSLRSTCSLVLLPLLLGSCILVVHDGEWDGTTFWSHSIRGSGVRAETDREVPEFHAIELETGAQVRVRVGEPTSLHLSGDDNLLPKIETKVEDGVLSIDLPGSYSSSCGLEVVIGTPTLEGFSIEGSGDVEIENLAADEVELAIEGSGTLRARGTARNLAGSIEGSGSLLLEDLDATEAHLTIEGSGSMEACVTKELHYSIEGSGDIRYAGEPRLLGGIEGSGKISRKR